MNPLRRRRGRVAILPAWIISCTLASAQQTESPVIRVDVGQVLVPVTVTDGKGHHVTGLKASDFHILEDDVAQNIAAFSVDAAPASSSGTASITRRPEGPPTSTAASSGRTVVICADALHSAFANSNRAREALIRLFENEKSAATQYVLLSIGRQLQVLQTATSDSAAILSRLHAPVTQRALGGGDAAVLRSELNDLKNRMYDFCKGCDCTSARGCANQAEDLKLSLDGQAQHWAQLREQFLAQLKSTVEELAKLPTGRTLILVSDGFSLQPAREFYGVAAAFLPKDERFRMAGPTDLQAKLQAIIRIATDRNVRIYCVDSRGLAQSAVASNGSMDASAPPDRSAPSVIRRVPNANRGGTLLSDMDHEASAVAFENGGGMEQLAHATGGVYFHDSNDMLKQFHSVLADGLEYYLLAYTPKNHARDGQFRKITVEVRDKKLHVQAKSGYWAEPAQN